MVSLFEIGFLKNIVFLIFFLLNYFNFITCTINLRGFHDCSILIDPFSKPKEAAAGKLPFLQSSSLVKCHVYFYFFRFMFTLYL